ncbi:hypothetical protein [Paracidobacterium acidisoli]|uniref:Uncharacterized protein n=1 Tax=Paracidobacterium acidisoli TaxID=2303751 RepID=A0A372ING1_9BACT|nr:hypothetical protein [Paracidobacterium acidisoli]MBT9331947.1 hypothetical protein [Paracidobacterium acidisoli]
MKEKTSKNTTVSEHEKNNEGGREFGHVHEPTQAQMASKNTGLADNSGQSDRQPPSHPVEQHHPMKKKSA